LFFSLLRSARFFFRRFRSLARDTPSYALLFFARNTKKPTTQNKQQHPQQQTTQPTKQTTKQQQDPKASKPEDWDERAEIDDPDDKKPDGYDDIPSTIADPKAKKPKDWSDEDDGEWEAPTIPNPDYKGEWKAKR
jgi:calreticulin